MKILALGLTDGPRALVVGVLPQSEADPHEGLWGVWSPLECGAT